MIISVRGFILFQSLTLSVESLNRSSENIQLANSVKDLYPKNTSQNFFWYGHGRART